MDARSPARFGPAAEVGDTTPAAVAPPRSADASPASLPRRAAGVLPRATDGRRWELLVDRTGVVAVTEGRTIAEAHIWAGRGRVAIEFWLDGADVPEALGAQLVRQAFDHPAVHRGSPILVCLPRRDGAIVEHARRHVADPHTRAAGMTYLVEGQVLDVPAGTGRRR